MELSETQKLLLDGLKAFDVEVDNAIGIMLLLKGNEACMNELMYYMADERPNAEGIMQRAFKIAGIE